MPGQSNINKIPEWNGDRENLPELFRTFMYKDRKYLAVLLRDGHVVFDTERRDFALGMGIRMDGGNSRSAVANLLLKSELTTIEEIAQIYDVDDQVKLYELIEKFGDMVERLGMEKAEKFLRSKGVTTPEILKTCQALAEVVTGPVGALFANFLSR